MGPMASDSVLRLSSGPEETVLAPAPSLATERLRDALAQPPERRREAVADVVAAFPRYLGGWAELGHLARDDVEAYACYRVGYHRGLDALRAAGWRGTGFVRANHEENRGFLACVEGLGQAAGAIGEADEQERCAQFLNQLDPNYRRRGPLR